MSSRVGWTAWFTAEVWRRGGLEFADRFGSVRGRLLHRILDAFTLIAGRNVPFLVNHDRNLLARHRWLTEKIESLRPDVVIEVAAGFSTRGLRMTHANPALRYWDTDLDGIVRRKRRRMSDAPSNLRLATLDAVGEHDWRSALGVDSAHRVVVVAEGLFEYLETRERSQFLENARRCLAQFEEGWLLFETYPRSLVTTNSHVARLYGAVLGFIVGRDINRSLSVSPDAVVSECRAAGFGEGIAIAGDDMPYAFVSLAI